MALCLCVAPLAIAVERPLAQNTLAAWGRPVLDIRFFIDNARMSAADFASQIVLKKDHALEPEAVTQTLKNLYATGRFRELRADADLEPGGVVVTFRGEARFFVGDVSVQGAPPRVDAATLASASRLRLGDPVRSSDLAAAVERLRTVLSDSGYYETKVGVEQTPHPDTQEADVTFTVAAGRAARLSGVKFVGETHASPAILVKISGWRRGSYLTAARVDRGLYRIRRYYEKRGRLEATVRSEGRAYDAQTGTERLTVHVEPGPQVAVRLTGARIPASELRRILPLYRGGATDDLALAEGARKIEYYLERRGYFGAQARVQRKAASNGRNLEIDYAVTPGERGSFAGYEFSGNHTIPSDQLASVVQIQPADFPLVPRGVFDRDLLSRDTAAIASLYHSEGFSEAKVSSVTREESGSRRLFVTFHVEEGPQTRVRRLDVQGFDPTLERDFLRGTALLNRAGQPYSAERAATDRDAIVAYLANRGYSQAQVTWTASPPMPDHRVDVQYSVRAGRQETVARVIVIGRNHTRASVIERQLSVHAGEPLSRTAILDSEQRLYDIGLFNQVQISPQDPAGSETSKTLLVKVEEAKRWTLAYGGGVDVQRLPSAGNVAGKYSASPRVSLQVDRLNLGGRPQSVALRGQFSNLEKVGSAAYTVPQFLSQRSLTFRLEGLYDQSRNVETFNSRLEEASVGVQKRFSAHASLLARYSYRKVEVSNLQIQPQSIPLFSQPVRVAAVSGSYANDHRDNPVDATRGSYTLADAALASSKLGSQANFARLSGQNSTYYRLRPYLIFARNTELGFESTYGRETVPGGVPLPERFFMGGSESHRGFSLNQAGPRDPITGFPLGGEALFLNQFELRLPVEENRLGFVLFNDAGNVFSSVGHMRLLKFRQSSPTDFDYDVQAVGAGLRYQTPVGPVRFDVGYALNPPRFQQCAEDVTQCPPGEIVLNRLPRVQFLLSVGQSF